MYEEEDVVNNSRETVIDLKIAAEIYEKVTKFLINSNVRTVDGIVGLMFVIAYQSKQAEIPRGIILDKMIQCWDLAKDQPEECSL